MTGGLGSYTDEPGQMLRSARIEKGLDVAK